MFQRLCVATLGVFFGTMFMHAQTANNHMVDFDGDGKKDIAVFRPSNGTWYLQGSSQGYWEYQWGIAGDIPVPGDYNGYGRAGAAVFRRFNSTWFISPVGAAPYQVQFGSIGDIPVPGDFDGDGKTDIAVFRPSNGTWYIIGTTRGYWEQQWGWAGDIPVPGDYDGDGKVEAAVFRPWNNTWYISTASGTPLSFGIAGDIPVPGDFDGDGKTDIAVYRPSNGVWYIQSSSQGALQYQWGTSGDIPVPGDYDGDGKIDTAVFRPWNNTWYIFASSTGLFAPIFGASGDIPVTSMYSTYLSAATPTLTATNLTHPNLAPNFEVGDTYRMTITGPPNQPVSVVQTFNGGTSQQSFGNTDSYGHMTVDYVEQTGNIGTYTQVWSVGGIQASPAVSFVVGQLGEGTLTSTELATNSTGQILGVSSVSIANGIVTSYSATEFDYQTSLYYDAGTVATMYEEGTPVRSASASGGPAAGGNLSFPATLWKDYTLITDHYATAYILNGGFYYNPYYFQSGSCDDYNTDCTFVPGGGYLYVSTALIYLGSTATEHTNVAIDGSDVPLSDNDAYTGFMDKVPPPTKDQLNAFKFSVTKILKDYRIAALVAASAYQHSQDEQVRSYQIPMFLKLIRDDISETAPPIKRTRRYKVLDIYGNSWRAVNPLRIDEYLTYVAGDLPLGAPNSVGWEIDSTHGDYNRLNYGSGAALEDDYSVGNPFVSDTSEIDFWQMYSASNFKTAGTTFPRLDSLGIVNGGVPLILILPDSPASTVHDGLTSCADFAIQSVRMSKLFVQFNGDNGPHGVCAY